jgi:hypothetical protein
MLEPSAERTGGTVPDGATPDLNRPSVLEMTVDGKETIMSPNGAPDESSASLTGSLTAFALSDVLMLLASTAQTGELHAAGDDVEGWLWLADGQLANARVGSATTIGQAVFELARITQGEFSFTTGVVSSSGHPTVPVAAVLQEVRPQVDEWRELRTVVPLDAEVNLSPSPPGQDVRIRNDQWRVLTTVGNSGLSVKSVLERIGGEQIVGLRTLRDLQTAGLIAVGTPDPPDWSRLGPAPEETSHPETAVAPGSTPDPARPPAGAGPEDGAAHPPEPPSGPQPGQAAGLAEVAIMPPPIAVDPWAPPPEVEDTGGNGVA